MPAARSSGTRTRGGFILYGVGDAPPASVAAIIDAAPGVVEVVWRPSPYTCAELVEECHRIMDRFPQISLGGA
jgi:hypothetical protein